jgi:tRNA threonylcarbamoyladenosine modification (KEOPS) complex  Pcc1 subunit
VSSEFPDWTATIRVRVRDQELGTWVERSLRPEAAHEVPRARTEVRPVGPGRLEVAINARDCGALRAALNTYLGWIHLSLATARAAGRGSVSDAPEG